MYRITSMLMVVLWSLPAFADKSKDEHYTDAGLFDSMCITGISMFVTGLSGRLSTSVHRASGSSS